LIRILNAEPLDYSEEARRLLHSLGHLHERYLTRVELLECLAEYDVLIVRLGFQVDREVIDAGTNLKVIVTTTTGLDHTDVNYAEQRGIKVLSLRGETEFLRSIPATAEHTWALLLALVRRIPWAFQSVLQGDWVRDDFRGHDLSGKRLGIVGLGRIGEKVACYGLAFGMKVFGYDVDPSRGMTGVTICSSLASLLQQSDVLTVHVPLNAHTEDLIGAKELDLLPAGSLLINTSRGKIVDERALLAALESGQLSGAALDVLSDEGPTSLRQESLLLRYARSHRNLLITPHLGGATFESMAAVEIFMARKLATVLGTIAWVDSGF